MNNIFSLNRFFSLLRQRLIEDYKINLISLVGLCGVIFFLLHIYRMGERTGVIDLEAKVVLFSVIFIGGGAVYIGSSFSLFRSKEKTIAYLLTPATRLEKFVLEYIIRIVLFLTLVPILFWLISNAELAFASLWSDKIQYSYQDDIFFFMEYFSPKHPNRPNFLYFLVAITTILFHACFLGSAIFKKMPLIKTIFSLAVIFFFNGLVFWLLYRAFSMDDYSGTFKYTHLNIFPISKEFPTDYVRTVAILVNMILVFISFLKLKEKEA